MRRRRIEPREAAHIRANHERMGFQYFDVLCRDGAQYWNESVAYEFDLAEVELIETATNELHELCMDAVEGIIDSGDYPIGFALKDAAKTMIEESWRRADPHIYGRFDLNFNPVTRAVKLFEYNADTPTALPEAAIAQWEWLEETGRYDQFNSIHEKLIERWSLAKQGLENPLLHIYATRTGQFEDWGNVGYMADVALQAGWEVNVDEVENIGWDPVNGLFLDSEDNPIEHAFKLYPWEWMVDEEFGQHMASASTHWYEPAWKMLLSNKAILAVLWQRNPDHPYLLPTYFEEADGFIRKPILGREGANVHRAGSLMEGSHFIPEYDGSYVCQEYAPLPDFDGFYPVIGSWVIGDEAAGMGIREDRTLISGNGSHFVPHYILEN